MSSPVILRVKVLLGAMASILDHLLQPGCLESWGWHDPCKAMDCRPNWCSTPRSARSHKLAIWLRPRKNCRDLGWNPDWWLSWWFMMVGSWLIGGVGNTPYQLSVGSSTCRIAKSVVVWTTLAWFPLKGQNHQSLQKLMHLCSKDQVSASLPSKVEA